MMSAKAGVQRFALRHCKQGISVNRYFSANSATSFKIAAVVQSLQASDSSSGVFMVDSCPLVIHVSGLNWHMC